MIESRMLIQIVFWGVWLVIPLLWEIFGAIAAAIVIMGKYAGERNEAHHKVHDENEFYPTVSIIIPVYNSEDTLEMCLQSVLEQEYPLDRLEVLLVDNGSSDESWKIFEKFQSAHGELKLWWHTSGPGKSRALNMGVFSGTGKYTVNIDSDGRLDRYAIANVVKRFEGNDRIFALTGVILTDFEQIEEAYGCGQDVKDTFSAGRILLKLIRQCELFEYCESFLVGRSFESIFNNLNTMAGAFSCFRREVLIKTQLYNTETMGEDAHMTSQVREFTGGRVELCENAFYFTRPLENLDKLYTQRQRWQRGELEVAGMFSASHLGTLTAFFKKPNMRRLISNHTLAFPRMIWLFATVYLYFINYPMGLLLGANGLLYTAYVLLAFLNIGVSCLYLGNQQTVRSYISKRLPICLMLPLYRFILYWIRMAGIINSLNTPSKWRTKTFSEEMGDVRHEAGKSARKWFGFLYRMNDVVNDNNPKE